MTVRPWAEAAKVAGKPNHPKVFVARGTHGNYLTTGDGGSHPIAPFSSETFDISRDSCGRVEALDDVIAGDETGPDYPSAVIVILKFLLAVWGWMWIGVEFSQPFGAASPNPSSKPVDVTPAANKFGRVIRPQGVAVPEPVTGI